MSDVIEKLAKAMNYAAFVSTTRSPAAKKTQAGWQQKERERVERVLEALHLTPEDALSLMEGESVVVPVTELYYTESHVEMAAEVAKGMVRKWAPHDAASHPQGDQKEGG